MGQQDSEQPALIHAPEPAGGARLPAGAAQRDPVAQVLLESAVPHLDRFFDYAVAQDQDAAVVPGCRVKVRFSGRDMAGYVVNRTQQAATGARLQLIHKVVSSVPVVAPEVFTLAEQVAQRGAGSTADVLRAAVPPRVASVEKEFAQASLPQPSDMQIAGETDGTAGTAGPRRAVLALRNDQAQHSVLEALGEAVTRCVRQGGGAVIIVPDQREVTRTAEYLETLLSQQNPDQAQLLVRLSADMGPTPRFRAFLQVRFGLATVVVGTRAAVFAPVPNLRLMAVVDDDDPSHVEPRAPYHHVRDVALLRTVNTGCELMFVSVCRSLEVQRLVEKGWLTDEGLGAAQRRQLTPMVSATADSYQAQQDPGAHQARMPALAYRTARQALQDGPVLVQVGRSGFVPALVCQRCREFQRCPHCQGPLAAPADHQQSGALRCRWCGLHHRSHRCQECGHTQFRAAARGADRTAQELGRAFAGVPVVSSTADQPVDKIGASPALVVSTPGMEPVAEGGYRAALLLDGDAQLSRDGLDVPRQVLSRWFRAASLVSPERSGSAGPGAVIVTAENAELTGALVRWDPVGYAHDELARRRELGLPPATRMISLTGARAEAEELMAGVALPPGVRWIGPTPAGEEQSRWLVFFSYAHAGDVVAEVRRARRRSSAGTGSGRRLRVAVDDVRDLQF